MKIKALLLSTGLAGCVSLSGAPLAAPTAVQAQPDASSTVIAVLAAGTEAPALADSVPPAPAGWTAVQVQGPFEGYVKTRDFDKQLEVLPGSFVYLAPKDGSAHLTTFQKGDKAVITGLHGSWTRIKLDASLVGYIRADAAVLGAPLQAPASQAPTAPTGLTAGQTPPAAAPTSASVPAASPSGPEDSGSLSRIFEGKLATTRSLLSPRRPYDWQLLDSAGKRIAYVDLSKLLLTDQIENYSGHEVIVLGSFKPVKDTPDLVIGVESLRLK